MARSKLLIPKHRKGQIEAPVSWIFILIAGAVILLFFFSTTIKLRDIAKQKLSITLLSNLDALISSSSVAKGTSQLLPIYDQQLVFECTQACLCELSVLGAKKPFKDRLIFAQQKVFGRNALFWALDWKEPFRIANFLYITDSSSKYWLVGDSSSEPLKTIKFLLPKNLSAEFVDSTQNIKPGNFKKSRIVLFDKALDESLADSFPKASELTLLVVNTQNKELKWYKRKGSKLEVLSNEGADNYKSIPHLLGAIFSDEPQLYACQQAASEDRKAAIKEIYVARVQKLMQIVPEERGCSALYEETFKNINAPEALEEINEELLKKSCPTIY
ncbi:MAG: hypothetical protein QXU88_00565 [Candidatus Woesearchaeota archaeon]